MGNPRVFHKQSELHHATIRAYDRAIDRYWRIWRKAVDNHSALDAEKYSNLLDNLYTRRFWAVQFGLCRLAQVYTENCDKIPF